ncbi:uncharacterized protein LOC121376447 [Gigantopelta aegis]|uniref:uncharacterized protein LOC121376447 n=1 Tax=Gigantopelta aegis TaxID=1735272 RepID=UPI001B88E16D|nr:uncharacterized protein LOC121376447 [Gigantopelta aegis]
MSREVHVLGAYQNQNTGDTGPTKQTQGNTTKPRTTVQIIGSTKKPVILVLVSHEAVSWDVLVPPGLVVEQIYLFAYHLTESSVTVSSDLDLEPDVVRNDAAITESDDDGSEDETVKLLKLLQRRLGYITSYSGTYQVDHWKLRVGN